VKDEILKESYRKHNDVSKPKPNLVSHCIKAFIVGGLFCVLAQLINDIYLMINISEENVGLLVTITMVFIGALLTGVGIYDKIGEFAGAGSIVPITGFANSIVSPAMEFKKEGFIFGVGAKMFTIAGPVLIYGISSSVLLGIIYYFTKLLGS